MYLVPKLYKHVRKINLIEAFNTEYNLRLKYKF